LPAKAGILRAVSRAHRSPRRHPYEPINTLTQGLARSPDEKAWWVTSLLDDAVYVCELKSQRIVARVSTGSGASVGFSPDGKYAGQQRGQQ